MSGAYQTFYVEKQRDYLFIFFQLLILVSLILFLKLPLSQYLGIMLLVVIYDIFYIRKILLAPLSITTTQQHLLIHFPNLSVSINWDDIESISDYRGSLDLTLKETSPIKQKHFYIGSYFKNTNAYELQQLLTALTNKQTITYSFETPTGEKTNPTRIIGFMIFIVIFSILYMVNFIFQ